MCLPAEGEMNCKSMQSKEKGNTPTRQQPAFSRAYLSLAQTPTLPGILLTLLGSGFCTEADSKTDWLWNLLLGVVVDLPALNEGPGEVGQHLVKLSANKIKEIIFTIKLSKNKVFVLPSKNFHKIQGKRIVT